jgi:transcriptional regulator with XRE-family HTH domain
VVKYLNNIKVYREEIDLSMHELARRVKVTPSYINGLEKGHRKNPSRDVMQRIADALGKTIPEVFFPEN